MEEIKNKLNHVNSIIHLLEGDAWLVEKSVFGETKISLEHDTKNRMLIAMKKYRNLLLEAQERCQ